MTLFAELVVPVAGMSHQSNAPTGHRRYQPPLRAAAQQDQASSS